jgi:hypothetical protein
VAAVDCCLLLLLLVRLLVLNKHQFGVRACQKS